MIEVAFDLSGITAAATTSAGPSERKRKRENDIQVTRVEVVRDEKEERFPLEQPIVHHLMDMGEFAFQGDNGIIVQGGEEIMGKLPEFLHPWITITKDTITLEQIQQGCSNAFLRDFIHRQLAKSGWLQMGREVNEYFLPRFRDDSLSTWPSCYVNIFEMDRSTVRISVEQSRGGRANNTFSESLHEYHVAPAMALCEVLKPRVEWDDFLKPNNMEVRWNIRYWKPKTTEELKWYWWKAFGVKLEGDTIDLVKIRLLEDPWPGPTYTVPRQTLFSHFRSCAYPHAKPIENYRHDPTKMCDIFSSRFTTAKQVEAPNRFFQVSKAYLK